MIALHRLSIACLCAVTFFCNFGGQSNHLYAEEVMLGSLPAITARSGFTMNVSMEAVAGDGYSPMYFTFNTVGGGAFNRYRRFNIYVYARHQLQSDLDFDWQCDVEVPQGVSSAKFPMYIPYFDGWDNFTVQVYEDGRSFDGGKATFSTIQLRVHDAAQKTSVGILVPNDASVQDATWKLHPDVRTLITLLGDGPLPEDASVKRLPHQAAIDLTNAVQPASVQFRSVLEPELHDNWLGYSQLDVMLASSLLIARIETEQPSKMSAIKSWIAAGGNLWVYAANETTCQLIEQAKLRKLVVADFPSQANVDSSLQLGSPNDTSQLTYQYWQGVVKQSQNTGVGNLKPRMQIFQSLKDAGNPFAELLQAPAEPPGVRTGSWGLGTITVIDDVDPFPGAYQFWKGVVMAHQPKQIEWSNRNGVDVASGNDIYWSWLIASVGQPPVKIFLLLNTLFAILVGPVCYHFFRRRERLYLLYFFAPGLALLVTTGLFVFAMFADGFTTRSRVRQLTWIDQHAGTNTTQSRQTYYSVIGSRHGLTFKQDTMVLPLRNRPSVGSYRAQSADSSSSARIISTADGQRFSGSFLPSRDQVQFLTTSPRVGTLPLLLELTDQGWRAKNQGLLRINQLLIRDHQSGYWQTEQLLAGATTVLQAASVSSADDLFPISPLTPSQKVPVLQPRNRGWNYYSNVRSTGAYRTLLEDKLQSWLTQMPPGTFVGIVELDPHELGAQGTKIADSIHVFMGELP